MFLPLTSGKRCTGRKGVAATARRSSCNRARRSSKRARIVLHCFIQRRIVCDRFRTVRSFRLNGWGVSYNGKGRSVFVSFRKNGTITLHCHIPYVCMYVCMYLCMYVRMYTCMYMYVCIHVCIQSHSALHPFCQCGSAESEQQDTCTMDW